MTIYATDFCSSLNIYYDPIRGILKVDNISHFTLIVSLLPIYPKRRIVDIIRVSPHESMVYTNIKLDIHKLSFRFEIQEKKE